jgi:crotonobetainyl-CoA:carnitine CoA-transferase CaiB-like acyl-CoA transferase
MLHPPANNCGNVYVAPFWLADLVESAFAQGEELDAAVVSIERALSAHPREHWLQLAEERGLPMGPVHGFDEAPRDPVYGMSLQSMRQASRSRFFFIHE